MYIINNKSVYGVKIDDIHISPKTSRKFNKIVNLDELNHLKNLGLISVSELLEKNKSKNNLKSNEKKTSKKSSIDTINYINDDKNDDNSEVIEDKNTENLGDEE